MASGSESNLFGPLPTVQAALLCDNVITEANTDKKSLIGLFDALRRPGRVSQLTFFARVTDAAGRYRFRLECVQVAGEHLLRRLETDPVEVTDRLKSYDLVLSFMDFDVPAPGKYEFRLYVNDAYLCHVSLRTLAGDEQEARGG